MASEKITQSDNVRELLSQDLGAHVVTAVGFTLCELGKDAASFRGLAKSLDELSALSPAATDDELRETAACIEATAMQALAVALGALSVSEQLQVYAAVRQVVGN